MIRKPSLLKHMASKCILYGIVSSSIYVLAIWLLSGLLASGPVELLGLVLAVLSVIPFGAFLGGILGIATGIYWGVPLGLVNALIDYKWRPHFYKALALTLIMAQTIALLFLMERLTYTQSIEWYVGFVFPIFIATGVVLYSMREYTHLLESYLRNQDPRKSKAFSKHSSFVTLDDYYDSVLRKEKPKRKNSEVIASDYDAHTLAMHADVTIREQEEQVS